MPLFYVNLSLDELSQLLSDIFLKRLHFFRRHKLNILPPFIRSQRHHHLKERESVKNKRQSLDLCIFESL